MGRVAKYLVLTLLLVPFALAETPQLKDVEFPSKSLGRAMHYRILLPGSYAQGNERYPVLYLLHGLYGDYKNWTDKTGVERYAAGTRLIIVMPDANDSWYTNWDNDPRQKYEDYIIHDLLSEVDARYRTIPSRDSRWIAGLSMGGYAAIKFGLKYPQLFSVVGSFSGAFNAATNLQAEVPAFAAQLIKAFGPANIPTRTANDIFSLARQAKPETLPYFYLTCGTSDPFLATNRELAAIFSERKIRYEYHESPGGHEWPFWDRSVKAFLRDIPPVKQ